MTTAAANHADWIRDLLKKHEDPLIRYAVRLTGDVETARDVVQDTFVKLIHADASSIEDHATEWLYTVCRNRCLDVNRKERRMKNMPEQAEQFLEHDNPQPSRDVDVTTQESHQQVFDALDSLPEKQQEVIRLKYQGGLSYREISRVTELTVSNVGFLIHTGMKTLRETLTRQARLEVDPTNPGIAR